MSEIFLCYARATQAEARRIAEGLRALGFGVWRDDEILAHRTYADVIEERLRAAKAVVVVWSSHAVHSQWVRAEAEFAREAGTLVQVRLDDVALPLPFNQTPCAELIGWTGDADHAGWRKLLDSATAVMQGAPPALHPHDVRETGAPSREPVIAVLAFDNLSGDPDLTYFSDGVSAEIQQAISRSAGLKVIARSSSFQFRGPAKAPRHLVSELKVTHILDGSVRRNGPRVRITTELIACADETTLWSQSFDRELSDVFAVQDDIAAAVADALEVTFAPRPVAGPIAPAVYDLYLRARDVEALLTPGKRMALLEQVTAAAPGFAPAWAWLAWWRAYGWDYGAGQPYPISNAAAKLTAQTALGIDTQSSLAFAALSLLEPKAKYAAREDLLQKAVAFAPGDPISLWAMGTFLDEVGRSREALRYFKQAYDLDPLYPEAAGYFAGLMLRMGRYAEGQRLNDSFLSRWPTHLNFLIAPLVWSAYARDWPRFELAAQRVAVAGVADSPLIRALLKSGAALREPDGRYEARVLAGIENSLATTGSPRLDLLVTAVALGRKDPAFAAVERASFASQFVASEDAGIAGGYTPAVIFDMTCNAEMIADVRFVRLCAKLGLCDYWATTGRWPDCLDIVTYDFKGEVERLAGNLSGPQPT